MLTNCSTCSTTPHKNHLKTISQIPDHHVCLCIECGSFWKSSSTGWELLLYPGQKTESQQDKILTSTSSRKLTLKLVKDFKNYQILYYWLDTKANIVSPEISTFHQAEEWIIKYHVSQYNGEERRKSLIDRRNPRSTKQVSEGEIFFSKRKNEHQGRRITDHKTHIDIDLSIEKIISLKNAIYKKSKSGTQ